MIVLLVAHDAFVFLDEGFDFDHFLLEEQVLVLDVEVFELRLEVVFLVELFHDPLLDLQEQFVILVVRRQVLALLKRLDRRRCLLLPLLRQLSPQAFYLVLQVVDVLVLLLDQELV